MKCEVCGGEPLRRLRGRPWMVVFNPGRLRSPRLISDYLSTPEGYERVCYEIATCGSRDCIQRASQQGAPGKTYPEWQKRSRALDRDFKPAKEPA